MFPLIISTTLFRQLKGTSFLVVILTRYPVEPVSFILLFLTNPSQISPWAARVLLAARRHCWVHSTATANPAEGSGVATQYSGGRLSVLLI